MDGDPRIAALESGADVARGIRTKRQTSDRRLMRTSSESVSRLIPRERCLGCCMSERRVETSFEVDVFATAVVNEIGEQIAHARFAILIRQFMQAPPVGERRIGA